MSNFTDSLIANCPYVFGDEIDYFRNLGKTLSEDSKVLMLGAGPGEQALLLHEGALSVNSNPFLDRNDNKVLLDFYIVDCGSFDTYIAHMTAAGFNPGIMLQYKTSDIYHDFKDNYFDVLVVDASHTYGAVKEDIEHYWKKVKIGGTVVFHDFVKLEQDNGVAEAIEEFRNENWLEIARPGISIVYQKLG